jgi:hypothetical protein
MMKSFFSIKAGLSLCRIATAAFLLLAVAGSTVAQYRGAPVKKNRLLQAIRTRQLQTRDIVTIINTNGVDFKLTPDVRRSLVAAGARPEVIEAVANNLRAPAPLNSQLARSGSKNASRRPKALPPNYDELLDQAIYSYKEQKNPRGAVQYLEAAARIKPRDPVAQQMLGFIYLYELKNPLQAEKFMRESLANGGSAVFRVYHDDNGKFTSRCSGSLYISQDVFRFESDDNVHTFETSRANVDKIKLDRETTRTWKKHSIFKIFLKIGSDKARFRFAPLTGVEAESKMVERFIDASSTVNKNVIITPSPVYR